MVIAADTAITQIKIEEIYLESYFNYMVGIN